MCDTFERKLVDHLLKFCVTLFAKAKLNCNSL